MPRKVASGRFPVMVQNQQDMPTIGFSPTHTLYRLQWQDRAREGSGEYVRCGADLLLNGLNRNLEGYAECPVCGTTTRLSIVNGKIASLNPGNAIMHVLETPTGSGRIWVVCEPTHIFDKKTCSEKWLSKYKGQRGLVTPVDKYHKLLIQRRSNRQPLPEENPKTRLTGSVKNSDRDLTR